MKIDKRKMIALMLAVMLAVMSIPRISFASGGGIDFGYLTFEDVVTGDSTDLLSQCYKDTFPLTKDKGVVFEKAILALKEHSEINWNNVECWVLSTGGYSSSWGSYDVRFTFYWSDSGDITDSFLLNYSPDSGRSADFFGEFTKDMHVSDVEISIDSEGNLTNGWDSPSVTSWSRDDDISIWGRDDVGSDYHIIDSNVPIYSGIEMKSITGDENYYDFDFMTDGTFDPHTLTDLNYGANGFGGGAGQLDDRFGFSMFESSVYNGGENGWGIHNGYQVKYNNATDDLKLVNLNYHLTWTIQLGATSEKGLNKTEVFTFEDDRIVENAPLSGSQNFLLLDSISNEQGLEMFNYIFNFGGAVNGHYLFDGGILCATIKNQTFFNIGTALGSWISDCSAMGEGTHLYVQDIQCYCECFPSVGNKEGIVSSTSTNLFSGSSTSFLYEPREETEETAPPLQKKPSTLDNVETDGSGNNFYITGTANGGGGSISSADNNLTIENIVNIPSDIKLALTGNLALSGISSGGGSSSSGGSDCSHNVTIQDDDVTSDALKEAIKGGYGLLDNLDTEQANDGFLGFMQRFYSAVDPDLHTILMFGVGTSIATLIIRNIIRH